VKIAGNKAIGFPEGVTLSGTQTANG